ncbi:MAG: hypothetical protein ACLFPI_11605 [Desulfobacterales bacterium]
MNNNFSRAKQRQYMALYTLKGLQEQIEACMGGKVDQKTASCLQRIEKRRLKMLESYSPTEKQAKTAIRKWKSAVDKYKQPDEWITPVEYVNACLVLANDIYEQGAKPANDWRLLTQSLFTLAGHLDPELNDPDQEAGQKMGEIILREF